MGSPPLKLTGARTVSQFDHAAIGGRGDRGQADRLAQRKRLAQQRGERDAALAFPMRQEIVPLSSMPKRSHSDVPARR